MCLVTVIRFVLVSHLSPSRKGSVCGGLKIRMLRATVQRMARMTRTASRTPFLLLSSPGLTISCTLWLSDCLTQTHPPSLRGQIPGRACEALRSQVYIWSWRVKGILNTSFLFKRRKRIESFIIISPASCQLFDIYSYPALAGPVQNKKYISISIFLHCIAILNYWPCSVVCSSCVNLICNILVDDGNSGIVIITFGSRTTLHLGDIVTHANWQEENFDSLMTQYFNSPYFLPLSSKLYS